MSNPAINAIQRVSLSLLSSVLNALILTGILIWDFGLFLYNIFAPLRVRGKVTPAGHPGAGGKWPEYVAPKEGDSRCSCPAINALANHGILPRDGRNVPIRMLTPTLRSTYNVAPTFCVFVPRYIAQILRRSYLNDTFDLADIDVHNGIEHDGSLTREDTRFSPDQSRPSVPLVKELLASASGPPLPGSTDPTLTAADLSRLMSKRRAESMKHNGQFSLSTFHKLFASSNSATLVTVFGGRVDDLRTWLLEERLPEGWESRVRQSMGLTIAAFQGPVLGVEMGVEEELREGLRSVI
ncbi:heme-thiolate peroxidase [Bondarzewia mesenterica]|uniref:Heme-thiolate peroxidase n=1 Tax=Bondarzewia mesenterica TaxID=1095465 RepID=A0A4S4LDI5_9AGAM|nr:heme-thiolate peroxidase [Bondarzewia mesenterica]